MSDERNPSPDKGARSRRGDPRAQRFGAVLLLVGGLVMAVGTVVVIIVDSITAWQAVLGVIGLLYAGWGAAQLRRRGADKEAVDG